MHTHTHTYTYTHTHAHSGSISGGPEPEQGTYRGQRSTSYSSISRIRTALEVSENLCEQLCILYNYTAQLLSNVFAFANL